MFLSDVINQPYKQHKIFAVCVHNVTNISTQSSAGSGRDIVRETIDVHSGVWPKVFGIQSHIHSVLLVTRRRVNNVAVAPSCVCVFWTMCIWSLQGWYRVVIE